MWPFATVSKEVNKEADAKQFQADVARVQMDAMHQRLEVALENLLINSKEEKNND